MTRSELFQFIFDQHKDIGWDINVFKAIKIKDGAKVITPSGEQIVPTKNIHTEDLYQVVKEYEIGNDLMYTAVLLNDFDDVVVILNSNDSTLEYG